MATLIAVAFVAAMVFPFFAATIVALYPGIRPERKVLFVFVSAIVATGLGNLLEIVLLIVATAISFFWPGWPSEPFAILPLILKMFGEFGTYFAWAMEFAFGIAVPVVIRQKLWTRLITALA